MAKTIKVSDDSFSTLFLLPGGTGELTADGAVIDDTIFGQTFQSGESGIISLGISANALYKGFAGYVLDIKKQGTSTTMTTEAMTLVAGKTYRIDDAVKEIWDRTVALTIFDNAVDKTAEVLNVDILFGQVTFKSSYSVTGPVTISGKYLPTVVAGKANSITLTQTAEVIDTTDFPTAQSNGGYKTVDPGLRSVSIQTDNIYDLSSGFLGNLTDRDELILEVNPDGNNKSRARGIFRATAHGQSGDVGQLEDETVTFNLNVPVNAIGTGPIDLPIATPFVWDHAADTTLSVAIQKVLTAWQDETKLGVEYLSDGTNGSRITAVVTDVSLTSGLDAMNEFAAEFAADGAATAVP